MTHVAPVALGAFAPVSRLDTALADLVVDKPTLVLDIDRVEYQYHQLKQGLGAADIHYAVKANPTREIIERLVAIGSHFDAASRAEIELCLSQGAAPEHISFGNTVKKPADIAFAHQAGIGVFAADAEQELETVSYRAVALGLKPVGLSFHVGSQTRQADMWSGVLDAVSDIWHRARAAGHDLDLLNIGGGFPAFYGERIDGPATYAARVMELVRARFGDVPRVMAEPGRGLVAEAGAILAVVLLVSRKSASEMHRWVYLDIGRFSGLAETEGEAIRYQFVSPRDGDEVGPCVMAGPSCDSADVLYEKRPVMLPLTLAAGDRIVIRNAGAYTSSYSSVGFNGFPPLEVVVL